MYHHITQNERTAIAVLLRAGFSQRKAARELKINQSSISRELRRNSEEGKSYHSAHANNMANNRRTLSKILYRKIEQDPFLAQRIEKRLQPLVSPEVIAHDEIVCYETIYA